MSVQIYFHSFFVQKRKFLRQSLRFLLYSLEKLRYFLPLSAFFVAGLVDMIEPKVGPWPQTVETSSGNQYSVTDSGVTKGDTMVFNW